MFKVSCAAQRHNRCRARSQPSGITILTGLNRIAYSLIQRTIPESIAKKPGAIRTVHLEKRGSYAAKVQREWRGVNFRITVSCAWPRAQKLVLGRLLSVNGYRLEFGVVVLLAFRDYRSAIGHSYDIITSRRCAGRNRHRSSARAFSRWS